MNIFKLSYRICRHNSREIYKGFGLHHLSDVTQYYVHPHNESPQGTTTVCQPIGESLVLFTTLIQSIRAGHGGGDIYYDDPEDRVLIDIIVPDDYRENGVVESNVYRYRAMLNDRALTIAAYDQDDEFIYSTMEHLHPLYKLLPCFLVLLAHDIHTNAAFGELFGHFAALPVIDVFVNVHEDFYQNHKYDELAVHYHDLADIPTAGLLSYSARYGGIAATAPAPAVPAERPIIRFPDDAFTPEQCALVPQLPAEFQLPQRLRSLANAIAAGDVLSVLLHGPAGTGKTMDCKLLAAAIGLPLLDTINCTENLDEFILGKYLPEGDRIVFRESYVTRAIREGGAVVFEEINVAKPQYLAFLNSLLDDNGFVRLDSGEVVRRHPHFRFFATMNMGYFGTKELNQSLYNRFNSIVEIAALSDRAIRRMLLARVPECEPVVDKLISVYHKIQQQLKHEELDLVISPRNLENWARLAKYEGYVKAAEMTIIPIAKCDRTLEDALRGIIMLYRWKG